MDWKAQIEAAVQAGVEAAVQAGVEAALQRSGYASVEESADETARRRTSWFGEAGRRRIEHEEDRVRRDPVWAEKIARRHAAFPLPWTAASAPTPSTVSVAIVPEPVAATSTATSHASTLSACVVRDGDFDLTSPITCSTQCPGRDITLSVFLAPTATSASSKATIGVVHEHCYFDPKPAAAASTTTSTSTAPASILSACVVRDGDLDLTSPTTFSSLGPGSDTSVVAASMMASVVLGEPAVTTVCTAGDSCIYPVAHPVDVGDYEPAMAVIMAPPTIRPALCHEPVPGVPVVVLTQATLESADSSGSAAWVSISAPLHKPEDADTAGTHEDEQLLACSSVERPLALVAASDVADDHNFVTGMSAMPLTLAPLGVDDDRIVSKHEFMITWDTSVNELPTKCNGMYSGLVCTTIHPNSLLPWDPGEKTRVSRVLVFCSTENEIGKCCGKSIYVELLQYQFDCASTFSKFYVERIIACAPGYPAICAEQVSFEGFLLEFFCASSNFHPLCLQAWAYWSLTTSSVPYHFAPITVELVFPYGSVSVPWKNAWSNLFDNWRANWSCEFGPYILRSQNAVLLFCSMEIQTLKGPMEQWDPGITRSLRFCTKDCNVSCHLIYSAITTELALTAITPDVTSLLTSAVSNIQAFAWNIVQYFFCYTCGTWVSRFGGLTYSDVTSYVHGCEMTNGFHYEKLWDPGGIPSRAWIFQWRVVLINGNSRLGGVQSIDQRSPLKVQSYTSSSAILAILNGRAKVQQHYICTRTVIEAVQLLNQQSSSNHAILRNSAAWFDHRATITTLWLIQLLKLIRSTKQAKGRRNAAAPAYYRDYYLDHAYYFDNVCADQDYYLDVLRDQVHIGNDYYLGIFIGQVDAGCYLNLVKVCLDYNTHRNLGNVMKQQAPWDPGGSAWHRLEVKPKFKEGGMLATFPIVTVGWTMGCLSWLGLIGRHRRQQLHIRGDWLRMSGLGFGRLRPPLLLSLLPFVFLCSPL